MRSDLQPAKTDATDFTSLFDPGFSQIVSKENVGNRAIQDCWAQISELRYNMVDWPKNEAPATAASCPTSPTAKPTMPLHEAATGPQAHPETAPSTGRVLGEAVTSAPRSLHSAQPSGRPAFEIMIDLDDSSACGEYPRPNATSCLKGDDRFAINCTAIDDQVEDFVRQSLAPTTLRAYRADLDHFTAWGGVIPATDSMVANYLAAHAHILAIATLTRRLATISQAHAMIGVESPTGSALVRATMRGIRRSRGTAQKRAKPLLRDDLLLVLDHMGDDVRSLRDRALLLLGFAGGFRRSELVGLDAADLETVRQGMIVTLRRSKTDQEGHGRQIGIPLGRTRHCPVAAVGKWLNIAHITDGPIFRSVDRHGHVSPNRLSGEAVCGIVRERLSASGIDTTGYSGHSLRAGFVTSAAQAGIASHKIRAQTGHTSDAMLARYVRDGELFIGNAGGLLL